MAIKDKDQAGTGTQLLAVDSLGNHTRTSITSSAAISGAGNAGYIPLWSAGTTLTDSIIDQTSGVITVTGDFSVSTLTATRLMASNGSKLAVSVADLTSWIAGTANQVTSTSDGDGTLTLSLSSTLVAPGTLNTTGLLTTLANLLSSGTTPSVRWDQTGAAADERLWDVQAGAGALLFRTRTDADGAGATWMTVDRTGTTVDDITLGANLTTSTVSANGLLTAFSGVQVSGGSAADGRISKTAAIGILIRGQAGSTADFAVYNPAGNILVQNPTGTNNLTVGHSTGGVTIPGTALVSGIATFTLQPIFSALTASLPVFTDASKGLVSNAMTGTGSVMMSASPTTTGTLTGAAANFSGAVSTGALSATTGTFSGRLVFGASTYLAGSAQVYTDAGAGLVIAGKTGTTYDLSLTNGAGSSFLNNPTGTTTGAFVGNVTIPGTLGVTGTLTATIINASSTLASTGRASVGITPPPNTNIALDVRSPTLSGASQYGAYVQTSFGTAATTLGVALGAVLVTANSAFTMASGYAIRIDSPSKGAASTITTAYGLKVEDQTAGGTNYAIHTGAGLVQFGGAVTHSSTLLQTGVATFTAAPVISADNIRIATAKTPASAGAAGTQGQIAWDADYVYVCTATNTWKRSAIATW